MEEKKERWPFHPLPRPDEALSSWIKRLAQQYGHDLYAILDRKDFRGFRLNNIDRRPSEKLVQHLSNRTGVPAGEIGKHGLLFYDDHFPSRIAQNGKTISGLEGTLTIGRSRESRFILGTRGIRYCPACLDDPVPYFRWYWLLGYYAACHVHGILMHDSCPSCNKPVNYFNFTASLDKCRYCNTALQTAGRLAVNDNVVNMLYEIFVSKISPLPGYTAQEFLGFFWSGQDKLLSLDEEYFTGLVEKHSIKFDKECTNGLLKVHAAFQLTWKLIKDSDDPTKVIPCFICDELFKERYSFDRHLESHLKARSGELLACTFCQAYFKSKTRLGLHLRKHHAGELKKRIKEVIERCKKESKLYTYVTIAEELGISRSLVRHPVFREVFMEDNSYRVRWFEASKLPPDKREEQYLAIAKEVTIVLKTRGEDITQLSVISEIGCSRNVFRHYTKLRHLVRSNKTVLPPVNDELLEDDLISYTKEAIEELKQQFKDITFRSTAVVMAKRDGNRCPRATYYNYERWLKKHHECRQLILAEGSAFEEEKKAVLTAAVSELRQQGKRITEATVSKKTGMPRDYLTNARQRPFLEELGCTFRNYKGKDR
jgi:uncharacterized C2H2 Zn-finger protein